MSGENLSAPPGPMYATKTWHKVVLVSLHFIVAICMILWSYYCIKKFNEAAFTETTVSLELPLGAHLKDGPAGFQYDSVRKLLIYRGSFDTQQQLKMRDLLEFGSEGISVNGSANTASQINETIQSYRTALDNLAFQASKIQVNQVQLLLVLGFIGGTLGAILRSLVDFVGHACYTGKLDLARWWPLYATRPIVGAILGFILVILLKARLLSSPDIQQGYESFWWLGVAVLGGFSTVDVTQRLRLAAKALFGTTHENPNDG